MYYSSTGMLDTEAAQYESQTLSSLLSSSGLMDSILGPDDESSSSIAEQGGEGHDGREVWLLLVASFLDAMYYSVMVPFMPIAMLNHGETTSQVGAVFAAYGFALLLGNCVLQAVPGVQVAPVVLVEVALLGLSVSTVGFLLAEEAWSMLMLSRFLQGLSSAFLQVGVARHLQDSEAGDHQMSKVMFATVVGMMIGPIVGGILHHYGTETAVWLTLLVALIMFGMALWVSADHGSPEYLAATAAARERKHKSYASLCSAWVLVLLIGVAIVSSVISAMLPVIPPYLRFTFEISTTKTGFIMSLFLGCYAFMGSVVGPLLVTVEPLTVMTGGFLAVAVALGAVMLPWGAFGTVAALCVVGSLVGIALSPVMPLLFQAANMHSEASFCQVYGLFDLSFALGVALGPLYGAALTDQALNHEQKPLAFQLVVSLLLVLGYVVALMAVQKTTGGIKETVHTRIDGTFESTEYQCEVNERSGLITSNHNQPSLL